MFYLALLKMQGQINEINFTITRQNGSSFPSLVNSAIIKDKSGELRAINATVYNITDRKKYEKELLLATRLAESEKRRFEFLANLIPEIIWTATADGEIDYVNDRFYQYFDLPETELDAGNIISKVHPEDRKKCIRTWITSIKRSQDFESKVRLQNRYNKFQWHLLRAMAYKDVEGNTSKWFGSCTNIHEHIIELQRKDEFINIASHELKTPITSLKAYNQLILRTGASEKVKGFLEKSATTLNNLHFLVSSLLDASKINSGQFTLNAGRVSLNEILKYSIELISHNYASHQVIEEYDSNEDIFIEADKQRITQVIINLLGNAIKYSPNADKVILRVTKIQNDQIVKIEVIDFGIGIPAEKLSMIFNKYYRVGETKNNNKVSGLGLGLYIIQNIIKLHGSNIYVTSKVDSGSNFYFSLPVSTESMPQEQAHLLF